LKATGIILAGGKSSRMGSDKGLINFKGKPMVKHIIETLESMNVPIMIIANNDAYLDFGLPVYRDLIEEKGPIGGIYTALHHTENDKNIIISCDTPFVSATLLNLLLDQSKDQLVTIPEFEGQQHPLIGVYDKRAIDVFKEQISNNDLKLQIANEKLNVKVVSTTEIPKMMERLFNNINTKEELNILDI